MISDFRDVFRRFYEVTGSNLVEICVERSVFDALSREIAKSCFWDEPQGPFRGVCQIDGVTVRYRT